MAAKQLLVVAGLFVRALPANPPPRDRSIGHH